MNDEGAAERFVGFSDDQDFDPDQPEAARPFEITELPVLPPRLASAALEAIARCGTRNGIALDVPSFVPTRAAIRTWNGYAMGEPVIGFITWRGVGEVRMNGVPGVLVAEMTVTDDAPVDATITYARVDLYFVAFAMASDAECVALVRTPGFPLPLDWAAQGAE